MKNEDEQGSAAAALRSWVASANDESTDFPIQNLPYGVFRHGGQQRIGVAIGDRVLDLYACVEAGLFAALGRELEAACSAERLNRLMSLGPVAWTALRHRLTELLDADCASDADQCRVQSSLAPMQDAEMLLPAAIGDYTDFYASIDHATRVGMLFRPDHPLLPNYKHVPIAYHGRSSSIVVSGSRIRRPFGQRKGESGEPAFAPSQALDYELEVGLLIGPGNPLGQRIPIGKAEGHIFGLCLVNDWSARDIQSWEYQPLGPFLAKNFATTISPWVVPLEALAPYRVAAEARASGDPEPLPYLRPPSLERAAVDLTLEAYLSTEKMRANGTAPMLLSRGNLRHLYWTLAQLVTHHTSNGCNLRPGDLLATGTISGPEAGSEGCLLEKQHAAGPVCLPTGETRIFLEDGDRVIFRAYTHRPGLPKIGFGACVGTVAGVSDVEANG